MITETCFVTITEGENRRISNFVLISLDYDTHFCSCPVLSNPMNYSMPGFPVQHQFLKLTQTHIL